VVQRCHYQHHGISSWPVLVTGIEIVPSMFLLCVLGIFRSLFGFQAFFPNFLATSFYVFLVVYLGTTFRTFSSRININRHGYYSIHLSGTS
jgi:hypothetical protein